MPAPEGNKYTQKYTEEDAVELFIKGLEYAESQHDCYSLADAIKHTEIPYSTYDYLAERYEVLGRIKKDTKTEVSRRINKGALLSELQPASAIWRLKQLGEVDSKEIKQTNIDVTPLTPEEVKEAKDNLKGIEEDF